MRSGPTSTEARGSRIAQGVFRTRLAACPMAELVTEHAEIASRLRRIATSTETSADTSEALASQLLETHVALLCTHMGSLPTSSGSSSTAQPATQRLLPMKPKRLPRPNQALSSRFTEVHAARAQARVAEHIRNNLFPRRRPESISRSPLQRRRIHKWRKDLTAVNSVSMLHEPMPETKCGRPRSAGVQPL